MAIKYIDQLKLKGKRAIIRVDYNVPYDENMNITDDTRIQATLKTLRYCIDSGATIIIISHLGRPKGTIKPELSLKPVAERLSELLARGVRFIDKSIKENTQGIISEIKQGDVVILENIRFYPEEESNDENFGKLLASLGDVYINDAFATAHRAHASNVAITHSIAECAAGFLLKDEIEYFKRALLEPEHPLVALIGGAKVSTKLNALKNILNKVDTIIIGGAMAFTFLKARGFSVGKSLLEDDLIESAHQILKFAEKNQVEILLPIDVVVAPAFKDDVPNEVRSIDQIPDDMMGLDIGPASIKLFSEAIKKAKTVVWNGPMGAFEMPSYATGTNELAKAIASSACLSMIGGGDSVSAVIQSGLADKMSYISTGGGAFLELLEGKTLPAIAALDR
jgi:3-phosphoglycerate kinase